MGLVFGMVVITSKVPVPPASVAVRVVPQGKVMGVVLACTTCSGSVSNCGR